MSRARTSGEGRTRRRRRGLRGEALRAALACAGLLGALAPGWGASEPPPDVAAAPDAAAALEISAPSLVVDDATGRARFEGGVVARRGPWVLRCPALEVRYDADGALVEAQAEGGVLLAGDGVQVEADAARLVGDGPEARLVLSGSPTLRRGLSMLQGEVVVVWLEARRVEVQGARGRFVPEEDRER